MSSRGSRSSETTPLLKPTRWQQVKEDLKYYLRFIPCTVYTNSAWTLVTLIGFCFIGRKGSLELSAVAFAEIWMGFCEMLLIQPLMGSLGGLVSQAVGAGHYHLAGIWLQLSCVVGFVLVIVVSPTWIFVAELLTFFRIELSAELAATVNIYGTWALLSLLGQLLFNITTGWFEAQEIVTPSAVSLTVSIVASALFNYLFVVALDLGVKGTALASCCTALASTFTVLFINCIMFKYHRRCWPGLHCRNFTNFNRWEELLRASWLPNLFPTALDELHNVLIGLFAATMGAAAITTQNVTYKVVLLLFNLPLSISMGSSDRVSTYLTSNDPVGAKSILYITVCLCSVTGGAVAVLYHFVYWYLILFVLGPSTHDPAAMDYVVMISPMVALELFLYSIMTSMLGVLDGQGRGTQLFTIATCTWLVSIPLAAIFLFVLNWSLWGVWAAEAIGYVVTCAVLAVKVFKTDWDKQAKIITERQQQEDDDSSGW